MQRMKLALAERHFLPIAIATLQLLLALQLAEHIHCVAHLVNLLSWLAAENCLVQHSAVQCQEMSNCSGWLGPGGIRDITDIRDDQSNAFRWVALPRVNVDSASSASKVDSATILLPSKSTKNGRGSIQRLHHSSQSTSTSNLTPLCKKVLF